jgi:hypothetical protein
LIVGVISYPQSTAGAMLPTRPRLPLLSPGKPALGTLGRAAIFPKKARETEAYHPSRKTNRTGKTKTAVGWLWEKPRPNPKHDAYD